MTFTQRELEIDSLRSRMTREQIAKSLSISRKTVEAHVTSINRKKQVEKALERVVNMQRAESDGSGAIGTGPVWGMQ